MIKHIVMWKIQAKSEFGSKNEVARKIKVMIEALTQSIPQIKAIEVGINFNNSDAAYDVVLDSAFETVQDLAIYQEHPEHKVVGALIAKVRTDRVVVDYEI
jgi:hypothetical protein